MTRPEGPPTITLTPREAALIRDGLLDGEPYLTEATPIIERIGKEADKFYVGLKVEMYRGRKRIGTPEDEAA